MTSRAADFVEVAHEYARLGWALVRAEGKTPKGTGWQNTKPEPPELAAGKWSNWGERWNIGLACGPSGLAVLDVDRDDDAEQAVLRLLGLDTLPLTPIVRTGRGERVQVYFRDPGGLEKAARDGFELRVGEHFCVLPPSEHPDTGRRYAWLPNRAPWEVGLAELPPAVVEFFAAIAPTRNGPAPPVGDLIVKGSRDNTLASLAGSMRRRGMGQAEILAALKVTNAQRCVPPLPDADVERIAASIAKRMPAAPAPTRESPSGLPGERPRVLDGAAFAFDEPADVPAVWGRDDGQAVLWAAGEGLMLVGPDGTGKTSIQQQLILARLGIRPDALDFPVKVAERPVLYVAADRPRQAARSLRRMVREEDREILAERLIVWKGPLPFDLVAEPSALASFVTGHGAGDLFLDALKDVAFDLSKDETGTRVSRAFQEVIAANVELCVSHHQRKEGRDGSGKPKRLADVYGSRWLTAGMGSVVLLWGEPGDLVVELSHLKQPADDVGPFRILHAHQAGTSSVFHAVDLEQLATSTYGGLTVKAAAAAIYSVEKPSPNQVEKARRRLEALVAKGTVHRDDLNGQAHYLGRPA